MSIELPKKIVVKKLLKGRYNGGIKPLSWDERVGGIDLIVDESGKEIKLDSTGDQSSPKEGWQIMLTGIGDSSSESYKWTLYGMAKS